MWEFSLSLNCKKPSYYEVTLGEFLETVESLTFVKTSNFFGLTERNYFPGWPQSVKHLHIFESCPCITRIKSQDYNNYSERTANCWETNIPIHSRLGC